MTPKASGNHHRGRGGRRVREKRITQGYFDGTLRLPADGLNNRKKKKKCGDKGGETAQFINQSRKRKQVGDSP